MFSYRHKKHGNLDIIAFDGTMNESVKECCQGLGQSMGNNVRFNFKEVDCVTSLGARFWLAFLSSFETGRKIEYEECSHEVIQQINIFPRFIGHGHILSFYGAFTCPHCGHEESILFSGDRDPEELIDSSTDQLCSECQQPTELDEDERAFFRFLDQTS
ncbi:hypothetical protein [Pseudobacteriovorax antillogorgiicola]|uniref:STAS domain-containing protein n=1 Tax=Pseudobacteriovorax antillogorgiicola TaxID=1513793 RepID=A0A1Y6B7K0_9BACT|nr:hypothetical protein [Pseudobacteriovorax antillogorgiicola]TCS58592.1 hypothetical protein EDD56_102105 [Pseudobacteriovorax antillogorgiicola]SME97128.1 hypothetical protein SAMN06296036_102338 [Pseudobacteriovorax antillogorgiicola]